MKHIAEDVPAPSALNPSVPPALDAVVARATAREAAQRWPGAGAMAVALQSALGGAPPAVADEGVAAPSGPADTTEDQSVWPIPGDRWNPSRIGRVVALVFGALLAIAVALLVARVTSKERPASARGETRSAKAAAARSVSAPRPSPTVPDVRGQRYEEAERVLTTQGFEVERNDEANEDVEGDVVFDSDPAPGSAVEPGATITLVVSTGSDEGEEKHEPPGHGGEPPGQAKKEHGEEHGD